MSALPIIDIETPTRTTARDRSGYVVLESPAMPRTRVARRAKVKTNASAEVLGYMGSFTLIAAATWAASCLVGQVQVEQMRRQQIAAIQRTRAAVRSEAVLRNRLDEMMRPDKIREWALAHEFVSGDVVASNAQAGTKTPESVDASAR